MRNKIRVTSIKKEIKKDDYFHKSLEGIGSFDYYIFAFKLLIFNRMHQMKRIFKNLKEAGKDENFMHYIENLEVVVSKILALAMVVVIIVAISDLIFFIIKQLLITSSGSFYQTLFKVFGLFLNVLIALEILENITGYLKKHVIQVELVITTSLIAVARKIIILDLGKTEGIEIIGLGIAVLALSISYFIIRRSHPQK
jgi:uncharacterized membrane protein (DUF373 family)